MAWAWDGPATNPDPNWFALSMGVQAPYDGDDNSSADLTPYGQVVVESPGLELVALDSPASSL
jgi:hypothetical protein